MDETGLDGTFEWTLTYAPPFFEALFPDSNLPRIFTALREQLGLTLTPRTAPLEVRVIDSASMPKPN